MTLCVNSQNRQLTDFDLYSYLPLQFSYSRRVKKLLHGATANLTPKTWGSADGAQKGQK